MGKSFILDVWQVSEYTFAIQKQPLAVFYKKGVFLQISLNSQESTCVGASFFNKVAGLRFGTLLKKRTSESRNISPKAYWKISSCFRDFTKRPGESLLMTGILLTLFRMGLFGPAHGWGAKRSHSLKSVTHIPQWWNLSKLCYIKKYKYFVFWYIISDSFIFFWVFEDCCFFFC